MKERMKKIIEAFRKYNSENMAFQAFGLEKEVIYDALVVAPSYSPYKLELDKRYDVVTLKEGQYIAGYLVKKDNKKIAWIKISSSESNLIDHVSICAELKFKKMIFIGAAGALKPEFEIGDICTPSFSIAGDNAHTFLKESIDVERQIIPTVKVR